MPVKSFYALVHVFLFLLQQYHSQFESILIAATLFPAAILIDAVEKYFFLNFWFKKINKSNDEKSVE